MCTLVLAPLPILPTAHAYAAAVAAPAGSTAPTRTDTTPPTNTCLRLVVNRDEWHTRAAAYPPEVRPCGKHAALMPIDPASDGTWVGVSDVGIAASLLNHTPPQTETHTAAPKQPRANPTQPDSKQPNLKNQARPTPASKPFTSRGIIIPHVLAADTLDQAIEHAQQLNPAQFDRFRLVLCNNTRAVTLQHTGNTIAIVSDAALTHPVMWASSGLGDHLAQRPRQKLLKDMLAGVPPEQWEPMLDAYMQHQWPDNTEQSVRMWRDKARTVSRTKITITAACVTLCYAPVAKDGCTGPQAELALNRVGIKGS